MQLLEVTSIMCHQHSPFIRRVPQLFGILSSQLPVLTSAGNVKPSALQQHSQEDIHIFIKVNGCNQLHR